MALSPVTERRIVTFLPPLLIAALLIPFAVRQNAWYEWENAYWFLQRQAEHVSAHGVPTLFLHTKDGSFYRSFCTTAGSRSGCSLIQQRCSGRGRCSSRAWWRRSSAATSASGGRR